MNKKIVALITSILTCVSVGAFVGCKDEEPSSSSSSSSTQSFVELEDFAISFGTSFEIDADGENLIWSSSNENVATVSQDGFVFGMGIGETTITVTDGVQTESCTLTVSKGTIVPVCDLSVQPVQIEKGDAYTLAPNVSVGGVTLDYVTFTYDTANDAVATVDANGVVTAVEYGNTEISVSYSAGGYDNTVVVPVSVNPDVIIELNQLNVTLAAQEIDGGAYSNEAEIYVTDLRLDDEVVDFSQVRFEIADDAIASFDNGTLTAKKVGATTLTAIYQVQDFTVTVDVAVNVVKESLRVEETGKIDVAWDATVAEPTDYAYIELPYSVQVLDEEVLFVTDANANVLSENNGLRVPKTAIKGAKTTLRVETETLVYEFDVAMETSYIQITTAHYASQFSDALGVKAAALGEEMDGRTDVLKTETPDREKNSDGSTTGHIWYTHCGFLNFGKFEKSWEKGVFMYDVKAEEGTYLGGYVWDKTFYLNTETMKFTLSSDIMKIVDENFEETTFKYGEWNTVVVDYTQVTNGPQFLPSFTGGALSVKQTAYYSNMRYMTKDMYERMLNNSYEKKYTVSFDTGLEDVSFASQEVSYRSQLDTSVLTMDDEYQHMGWIYNDQLIDVDKLYVTQDMTLTAVYDKEYEYTVYYLQRQFNGTYKIVDTFVGEGKMLTEVTAEIKTFEGYTYNESLSVTQGKVLAFGKLALAVYYDDNDYTFETQAFGKLDNRGATITKEAMTGVPVTDLQPNTYKMTPAEANWYEAFVFTYPEDKVGTYLVMNVYFTSRAGAAGWAIWDGPVSKTYPIYSYDTEGEFLPVHDTANLLNKWINVVVQIPEGIKTNQLRITFSQWAKDTWYMGEYTYLTEEQFKANFHWVETDVPTGTTRYAGSTLAAFSNGNNMLSGGANGTKLYTSTTAHYSGCTIKPNAVTSWTAGQYVAITVKSYTMTGNLINMYDGNQAAFNATAVYDEAGNKIDYDKAEAGKWYTYVFKLPNDVPTIELYKGSIRVLTESTAGYKFMFESVYSITDDTAYAAFKTWKGWDA